MSQKEQLNTAGQPLRCVVMGEQSLLIQCSELLISKGFEIIALVADDAGIQRWADQQGIIHYEYSEEIEQRLANYEYEYLFSITNLRMLSDSLLKQPKVDAINFHDGPLPAYAGLNAPSWAIINHETQYGVSWHRMASGADKGEILSQDFFDLDENETSFTINAKCYEVAFSCFESLVAQILSSDVKPLEQDFSTRSYFGKSKRPENACTIDWQGSADNIVALVNALDWGPYFCPLGRAKIFAGDDASVLFKKAEVVSGSTEDEAGTLVKVNQDSIVIAVADGEVALSDFVSLSGKPLSTLDIVATTGLREGSLLPELETNSKEAITRLNAQVSGHEEYWIKQLQQFEPLEVPYAQRQGGKRPHRVKIEKSSIATPAQVLTKADSTEETLLALLALFFSRLAGKTEASISLATRKLQEKTNATEGYFSRHVPLNVNTETGQNFQTFSEAFVKQLWQVERKSTFLLDVCARQPGLNGHYVGQPVPVVIAAADSPNEFVSSMEADLAVVVSEGASEIEWYYNSSIYSANAIELMQQQLLVLVGEALSSDKDVQSISILTEAEKDQLFKKWNDTAVNYDEHLCVHQLFEAQVEKTPHEVALAFQGEELTYSELNQQANKVASYLVEQGVRPGDLVGILIERCSNMIVAMMGVLKSGAAYVPLDPVYPQDRLAYMVEDAKVKAVLSQERFANFFDHGQPTENMLFIENVLSNAAGQTAENLNLNLSSSSLAYTIYTSGSTGKPKGVMVSHRNAHNFFVGMDDRIAYDSNSTWLAVTSISFDISVLEIFWTLSRGLKVVLYSDEKRQQVTKLATTKYPKQPMGFSLFYWNVATEEMQHQDDKYRLVMEGAQFADQNGFEAVWNPERHFHAFGGLFPNPAVTAAAIAATTKHVEIRAGSCVLPLHTPIRVAEEWAMVDNLSNGRVGLAIAAGWQPNDFVLKPENHARAKDIMFENTEVLKKLWRGEKLPFPGPKGEDVEVRTLPRPIQKEIPIWITSAGNPDTYRRAGETGAHILTHLLGQTLEELDEKIKIYKEARKAAGYETEGKITLMLHTLVGPDAEKIKDLARKPMKEYLKSAMFLVKDAAWHFPTFKEMSKDSGKTLDEFFETISDEDMDGLLEFAFERYYSTSGLFGSVEQAVATVDKAKEIGVTEIGCLIDYGLDTDVVIEHFPYLNQVRQRAGFQVHSDSEANKTYSIPELMTDHNVTHFQCTPSMAMMLMADTDTHQPISQLKEFMVGGEAFPPELAKQLKPLVTGRVTNMYGPTETTIWSSTHALTGEEDKSVSIGRPIANTKIYILDEHQQVLPQGVPGELVIGGDGVVPGYLGREELTKERFLPDPFIGKENSFMYRTGDLAKFLPDGRIECLGRMDHQVKIRGYRVELGEIDNVVRSYDAIHEGAVILREDSPGDKRLVAYVSLVDNSGYSEEKLKQILKDRLPEFMVPSVFVVMPALPQTPNGKIDRKALPKPSVVATNTNVAPLVQPTNDTETLIAEIWQNVLNVPNVGLDDNFFDIGGHSLLVVQVLQHLRKNFEKSVQMTDLFRYTTVRMLANYFSSEGGDDDGGQQRVEDGESRAAQRRAMRSKRRRRR